MEKINRDADSAEFNEVNLIRSGAPRTVRFNEKTGKATQASNINIPLDVVGTNAPLGQPEASLSELVLPAAQSLTAEDVDREPGNIFTPETAASASSPLPHYQLDEAAASDDSLLQAPSEQELSTTTLIAEGQADSQAAHVESIAGGENGIGNTLQAPTSAQITHVVAVPQDQAAASDDSLLQAPSEQELSTTTLIAEGQADSQAAHVESIAGGENGIGNTLQAPTSAQITHVVAVPQDQAAASVGGMVQVSSAQELPETKLIDGGPADLPAHMEGIAAGKDGPDNTLQVTTSAQNSDLVVATETRASYTQGVGLGTAKIFAESVLAVASVKAETLVSAQPQEAVETILTLPVAEPAAPSTVLAQPHSTSELPTSALHTQIVSQENMPSAVGPAAIQRASAPPTPATTRVSVSGAVLAKLNNEAQTSKDLASKLDALMARMAPKQK